MMPQQQNKTNYQKELEKVLARESGRVPTLLLHSCCAPCSSYVMEYLAQYFSITVFYYNPNIYPEAEYEKRVEEQQRLIREMNEKNQIAPDEAQKSENIQNIAECEEALSMGDWQKGEDTGRALLRLSNSGQDTGRYHEIRFLAGHFDPQEFYHAVKGLEKIPEGGERCHACFRLRLTEAAKIAKEGNYDYVTTTLTISPLKNAEVLNRIGQEVANACKVTWLPSDFKKKNGYRRSVELSAEYGLYRQDYCGCVFSRQEREAQKAAAEKLPE